MQTIRYIIEGMVTAVIDFICVIIIFLNLTICTSLIILGMFVAIIINELLPLIFG